MTFENRVPFYLIQTLHSLRLKYGMNSTELAERLGISTTIYEEWEKDSSNISFNHILSWKRYFKCHPSIFFSEKI